jgi:Na+-translocating ferredoxin:NAD+ oxidoreductase subunit G
MREIGKLVLVLGIIGVVSASTLAYVRAALAPRIEQQSDLFVRGPALERLFKRPAAELLANKVVLDTGEAVYPIFFDRQDGEVVGLAVEAAGHGGYGGDIVMMIAVDLRTGKLTGTEIIMHSETPGVGSQVEKPSFRKQWLGLAASEPVALRSDGGRVDAISGATFSSRAMIEGTNQVVQLVRDHQTDILARIADGGATTDGGKP